MLYTLDILYENWPNVYCSPDSTHSAGGGDIRRMAFTLPNPFVVPDSMVESGETVQGFSRYQKIYIASLRPLLDGHKATFLNTSPELCVLHQKTFLKDHGNLL